MLWWAPHRRDQIDPSYLAHPARAVLNYFYLNPFAKKRIRISALHYIAFAPAVLMFKAVVSLNNSLIAAGLPDLITPLAVSLDKAFANDMATYWTIIIVLFHPLWWASLHLVARGLLQENERSAEVKSVSFRCPYLCAPRHFVFWKRRESPKPRADKSHG